MTDTSAPIAAPIPRPEVPFPLWRLGNNIKSASDPQLEAASESSLRWGRAGAGLVVIGVAAEFALAAYHPQYDSPLDHWGTAVFNFLVAIGIAGEILFSAMAHRFDGELGRRAKKELAEAKDRLAQVEFDSGFTEENVAKANARAAEAQERAAQAIERAANAELETARINGELEKLRLPRRISEEAEATIVSAMNKFAGTEFAGSVMPSGNDTRFLWIDIWRVLTTAGWVLAKPIGHEKFGSGEPWEHSTTFKAYNGVFVGVPFEFFNADESGKALASALIDAGIFAQAGVQGGPAASRKIVTITVGPKPP